VLRPYQEKTVQERTAFLPSSGQVESGPYKYEERKTTQG